MAFYADKRRYNSDFQGQNQQESSQRTFSGNHTSFKKSNKHGASYFCNHCKIPGHNIERCFKIHGYPPGFQPKQDRKVAAIAQTTDDAGTEIIPEDKTQTHDTMSLEQYNNFLKMLNQQHITTPDNVDNNKRAHMISLTTYMDN